MARSYDELTEILTGWDPWSEYADSGEHADTEACTYCSSQDTSMADPYTSRPCCRNCFFQMLDEEPVDADPEYITDYAGDNDGEFPDDDDAYEVTFEADGCAT